MLRLKIVFLLHMSFQVKKFKPSLQKPHVIISYKSYEMYSTCFLDFLKRAHAVFRKIKKIDT